jgi:hypothetical protein
MISENMLIEKEIEINSEKEQETTKVLSEDEDLNDDDIEEEDEEDEEDENEDDDEDENENEEEDDEENNKNIDNEPQKKKRGRKSKPKEDNPEEEKIQKKRGRKPKVKELDTIEKIPKKRGRKPKEKIYSVKELPKTFFEENKNETFILHLPIKMSDRDNNLEPKPLINNNYSMLDNEINNNQLVTNNISNILMTQDDLLDNLVFDNDDSDKNDKIIEKNNIDNLLKKKEFEAEKDEDENKPNKIIKKNLRNIMYEFINSNSDKTWPDSTNTYCWWCCHPFNGPPCALPELYRKEKFYVSGCFCSFNCTAAYNFSKNDDNMWERYSLLNLMYKKLYNQKFIKINLAPPREILKIFGGYMTIDEFRENSLKNEKIFTVIRPPLISIIPKIEENISNANKNAKNNILNVNENILNKTQNNLKLKRNKPITNPNSTLSSFMDLKII